MQKHFIRHDPHALPRKAGRPHPAPTAEVSLEILRGRARNSLRTVQSPVYLIGAATDCDLVLAAPRFPEVYAYLLNGPQGVAIRHLGFTPEMKINGKLGTNVELLDGDRLEIGPFLFQVHIRLPQQNEWSTEYPVEKYDTDEAQCSPATPWQEASSLRLDRDEDIQAHVTKLLKDIRQTLQLPGHEAELPSLRLFGDSGSH